MIDEDNASSKNALLPFRVCQKQKLAISYKLNLMNDTQSFCKQIAYGWAS